MYHVSINYESEEMCIPKSASIYLLSSDISLHGNKNICQNNSNLFTGNIMGFMWAIKPQ